MNKGLKVFIGVIIAIIVIWGVVFCVDYVRCANFKMPIFVVAGETADDGGSGTYYGLGYRVEVKKNLSAEYGVQLERIEMYMFNKFITGAIAEVTEFPNICEYNLEGSNYVQKFEMNYNQRKDLGIKTIIDKNSSDKYDYSVCTFGGDVTITIEGDMVYSLEDALSQNVISVEDILNQAKMDETYGLCESGYCLDGGSTEYLYTDYTILKYNTLDGNKDLYIGMRGQIINKINNIIE